MTNALVAAMPLTPEERAKRRAERQVKMAAIRATAIAAFAADSMQEPANRNAALPAQ